MSEMKLTKGPWRAWHNHIFAGPFNVIKGGISGFRAELCTLNEDDLSEKELADIGRLIAAAPDLLAVIRYAVDNPDFNSDVFDQMARAAIIKATRNG